jgi:lipoprotein-anchoring transpeptidase ErfK/SrfK
MSMRFANTSRRSAQRGAVAVIGLLAVSLAAAGCNANDQESSAPSSHGTAAAPSSSAPTASLASVTSNLPKGNTPVRVSKTVKLHAAGGTFDAVRVSIGKSKSPLAGKLSGDKSTWTSTQRLEPGLSYRVHAVAVDSAGVAVKQNKVFRTDDLTLDQQTYPSIAPLQDQIVGIGMPVIVHFDVAVRDKKSIERHLSVQSSPHQVGAWHWISDNEVHWRPKHYWKPGTNVTVNADVDSIPAGHGVWGQLSRSTSFHIGDSVMSHVNILTHRMNVMVNGKLARSIPISAGMAGFTTRSGIKVVIEKDRHKRMDASTIGISKSSPDYYNLSNVEYAMRVTYSGEFVHAAPWSVGSQGNDNVSHGCVGMSTANAAWLYNLSHVGDIVRVTGSDRHMTLTNGYGDWNESFAQWKHGSALS